MDGKKGEHQKNRDTDFFLHLGNTTDKWSNIAQGIFERFEVMKTSSHLNIFLALSTGVMRGKCLVETS